MTKFIDAFSEEVWAQTYKDHAETNVDGTLRRVATAIASVETTPELRSVWQDLFYDMLQDFKVTCGGRTYSNAGTEWGGTTLLNCFVSPRPSNDLDSLDKIIDNLKDQSFTLKSEGGWGENFSYIRPRGSFIHGIGVESPGAVKYMELFDKASEIITAGSGKKSTNAKAKKKIRKGAMMSVLDCTHPDIIEFVTAKQSSGRLSKFNMSVNMSDEFMQRVTEINRLKAVDAEANKELIDALDKWDLIFPDTKHVAYKTEWDGNISNWQKKGYPVVVHNTISTMWLWNLVMESTYNRAEPGVLFLDRANKFNPLWYGETIMATNPCGEQTLAPGGVCCLGSINLTQFVANGKFDMNKIAVYAKRLVRFLDNVNDYSDAPLPEYKDSMQNKRRIGIGVMGWGSALLMMKVRFGSEKAHAIRDELMANIARYVYEASIDLAIERGKFKYCDPEKHAAGEFIQNLGLSDEYMGKLRTYGIRNSSLLSCQPTGNTGIFANMVSGGIEPLFSFEYVRTSIVNKVPDEIADVTPKWFEGAWHETEMFKFAKEGDEEILRGVHDGVVYKIDKNRGLTKEVECKDYGVRYLESIGEWDSTADWAITAMDGLTAQDHLTDLVGFAKYVDSALSKTVNIPNDYPFEDFQNIYLDAYNSGYVKGVTTYRAGTMTAVLATKESETNGYEEEIILDSVKMPASSEASMKILRAEGRKWYLTVVWNETKTRPIALFVHTNAHEKSVTTHDAIDDLIGLARSKGVPEEYITGVMSKIASDSNVTKLTRVISLLLRHGVLIKNIVAVLDNVENVFVGSFLFQIKKYLATFIKDGEKVEGERCLECKSDKVVYREGCKICLSCGSSRCG